MKKKWIALGVIIIIIVLVFANIWKQRGENSAEVETTALTEETIEESVIIPGKLTLSNEQTVYFQADKGEVDEILVEEGDEVKKGDQLVRYKNEELLNEQQQNELQIRSNHLELENIRKQHQEIDKELDKDKNNTQLQAEHDDIELQQRQRNLEAEQTQLEKESIEQKIAEATVKSDISGTVVAIDEEASAGAEQTQPKPLIQIGSLDSLQVKGEISEYDTLNIKKDQPVTLTSDAVPGEEWEGKVSFVADLPKESEAEDGESGAEYPVEVTVEDEKINLKPGFEMLMEIETNKKEAKVLPLTAVEQDEDKDYIYVVEDGKAKRKEIIIGATTNEVIEVKKGIKPKEKVILNPIDVQEEMEVTVQ